MKTKKLLAVILTLALVLSLSLAAFADNASEQKAFQDAEGIEHPADLTDHVYKAYQIFTGTQSTDPDDATLGAVEWGDGVNGSALLAALQAADSTFAVSNVNPFDSCTTAADVAAVLGEWNDSSAKAKAFAKLAYANKNGSGTTVVNEETNLDAGYYLVVDETSSVPVDDGDNIYNLSLLQLTKKGTFAITVKVEVPSVEKKLTDASGLTCTDKTEGHVHTRDCYTWANTNQVAIGDKVDFQITAKIPAGADNYNFYCFVIGDDLSDGLTLDTTSIKVFFNNGTADTAAAATDYTLKTGTAAADDYDFQVALLTAKDHEGETVVVTYSATLNENAIIGAKGNPNAVDVTYSKKPDHTYDPTDGFPGTNDPVGETPDSTTKTFVTGLKIYKVDEKGEVLKGAAFTISGEGTNKVLKFNEVFTVDTSTEAKYWKLQDGSYTTTAPITENTATADDNGKYVVKADGEPAADTDVVCGSVTYRLATSADSAAQHYSITLSNANKYDSTTTKYKRETTREEINANTGTTITFTEAVNDNGKAFFVGLPAGTYTITESTVPAGYNPIDDITVVLDCTLPTSIDGDATWSGTYKVGNGAAQNLGTDAEGDNVLTFTVENQKGNVLPETGGIGTTIFYVVGGVLVAAAGILLVTKKRMNNAE